MTAKPGTETRVTFEPLWPEGRAVTLPALTDQDTGRVVYVSTGGIHNQPPADARPLAERIDDAGQLILQASMSATRCPCAEWPQPCAYHLGMAQALDAVAEWAEEQ